MFISTFMFCLHIYLPYSIYLPYNYSNILELKPSLYCPKFNQFIVDSEMEGGNISQVISFCYDAIFSCIRRKKQDQSNGIISQ